jgi:hypothetical protein
MTRRLRAAIGRFHRDTGAALAPIFGFVLLFFAWGIGAIINTGEVTYDKVRTQNGADILALAQADQMARDLNVMALNNIAMTQMLVVGVISFSMQEELIDVGSKVTLAATQITQSASQKCQGYPAWVAFCLSVHLQAMTTTIETGAQAARIQVQYRPDQGVATASRMIGALNRMNDYIVESFPRRSGELLRELASANRIDSFFVYPPCRPGGGASCTNGANQGSDLPLERTQLTSLVSHREVCKAAEEGSDGRNRHDFYVRGFPNNKGPYTAGGAADRHVRDHASLTAGFGTMLPRFDMMMEQTNWLINFTMPPRYTVRQLPTNNHFTRLVDTNWSMICSGAGGVIAGLFLEMPRPYWIEGRSLLSVDAPDIGFLAADYEKMARLVVVARRRGERFNPENFKEREDPYNAYAQALTFNSQALDLYTSRWTSRLTPAAFMDKAHDVANRLPSSPVGEPDWFGVMRKIILAEPSNSEWSRVNLH